MSQEQRDTLETILRHGPLDLGGDLDEQRPLVEQMLTAVPVPDDVISKLINLGGVPALEISTGSSRTDLTVLYLHGGAYALGSAASSVGLAAEVARRAAARAITIDYRLAPEHPYPAAITDTVAAYRALLSTTPADRVILAGESVGAGLVAATLVALKHAGLPQPAAAVMLSPWADLSLSGASLTSKAAVDPTLTRAGLARRAQDYLGEADPADPRVSPIFADLTGLPPLLIQTGSHEILIDDAIRLAARAAAKDVQVTLQVFAGVPHVFQAFAAVLDEGEQALAAISAFVAATVPDGDDLAADDPTRRLTVVDPDDPTLPHVGVVSDTYTILVSADDTAGRYALIDMLIPPLGGPPLHRHDFEEMFHVLEGEVAVSFRDQTVTAHKGMTVNIPARAPHHFTNSSDRDARLLCMVSPPGLEQYFEVFGDPLPSRTAPAVVLDTDELQRRLTAAAPLATRYRIENLPPASLPIPAALAKPTPSPSGDPA